MSIPFCALVPTSALGVCLKCEKPHYQQGGNFFSIQKSGEIKKWVKTILHFCLSFILLMNYWSKGVEMCLFFLYKNPLLFWICWKTTSKSMKHFFFVELLSSILSRLGFLMHFKSDLRDLFNSSYIFCKFNITAPVLLETINLQKKLS